MSRTSRTSSPTFHPTIPSTIPSPPFNSDFSSHLRMRSRSTSIDLGADLFLLFNPIADELNIQIDQKVFGWKGTFTSIFGHIFFMATSMLSVYIFNYRFLFPFIRNYFTFFTHHSEVTNLYNVVVCLITAYETLAILRYRRRIWLPKTVNQIDLDAVDKLPTSTLGRLRHQFLKVRAKVKATPIHSALRFSRRLTRRKTPTSPDEINDPNSSPQINGLRRSSSVSRVVKSLSTPHHSSSQITPSLRIPYSHGGYFGAAPFMLSSPLWVNIFRTLQPLVYCEIGKRIDLVGTDHLIKWSENSAVMAGYGMLREFIEERKVRPTSIEWDLFVDPMLVKLILQSISSQQKTETENESKKTSVITSTLAEHVILSVLIAHGTAPQVCLEQISSKFMRSYVFSRVKLHKQSLGGGVTILEWMRTFAKAIVMGCEGEWDVWKEDEFNLDSSGGGVKNGFNLSDDDDDSGDDDDNSDDDFDFSDGDKDQEITESTPLSEITIEMAMRVIRKIFNHKYPLRIVLDCKSRFVPHAVWATIVDALVFYGIEVEYIASFNVREMRGVSDLCHITDNAGGTLKCKEAYFFHTAGDLQSACHEGLLKRGDHVFFNAGSLLHTGHCRESVVLGVYTAAVLGIAALAKGHLRVDYYDGSQQIMDGYSLQACCFESNASSVRAYQKLLDLSIGCYVQEFAIDCRAADLLTKHINDNLDTYKLGLSWGGVNGRTLSGVRPNVWTVTDGLWSQRYPGRGWKYELFPGLIDQQFLCK